MIQNLNLMMDQFGNSQSNRNGQEKRRRWYMEKLKKIAKIVIPVALMVPLLAFAALPEPTSPLTGNPLSLTEVQAIIQRIATFLIVVSIIVAVGFIVWGAIVYISAGGNEDRAKAGRKYIINGVIGAAVVFAIGVILQTTASIIARTFFG
jgi:formate hydrogenlyase subunit 3/multisubunit Na+/H+ antiporter MnhD subunit